MAKTKQTNPKPAQLEQANTLKTERAALALRLKATLVAGNGSVRAAQALRGLLAEGIDAETHSRTYDAMWRALHLDAEVGHLFGKATAAVAAPALPAKVVPQVKAVVAVAAVPDTSPRAELAGRLKAALVAGQGLVRAAQALRGLLASDVDGESFSRTYDAMWRRLHLDAEVGHLFGKGQAPAAKPLAIQSDRDRLTADVRAAILAGKTASDALRGLLPDADGKAFRREYDAMWRRLHLDAEVGHAFTRQGVAPAVTVAIAATIVAPLAPKAAKVVVPKVTAPKAVKAPKAPKAAVIEPSSLGGVNYYVDTIKDLPMLKGVNEKELFTAWRERGDLASRDRVLEGSLRFVVKQAMKYKAFVNLDLQDLISEGNLGLFEALKRFDPERGIKFLTYAGWWTKMSIMNAILHHGRTIRLPERMAESVQKVKRFISEYERQFGKRPDAAAVAEGTNHKPEEIARIQGADMVSVTVDITPKEDSDSSGRAPLSPMEQVADDAASPLALFMDAERAEMVQEAMALLPKDERMVIAMRFGFEGDGRQQTFVEVAEALGVSREWARKKEMKALATLSNALYLRMDEVAV
jgi:RNA polymerase primary sigma factor